MNKIFRAVALLALSAILFTALFSCSGNTADRQKTDVMKEAFDLLDEMIGSEYYLKGLGVSEDRYGENLRMLKTTDLGKPDSVFRLTPDSDALVQKVFGSPLSECDGSEKLKEFVKSRAKSSFFSYYFIPLFYTSSTIATDSVALASYLVSTASGYDPDLPKEDFLIYFYDGFALCAEVSGDEYGMRSVLIHPYFIGTVAHATEEDVKELLGIKGNPGDPAISKVKG